MGWTGGTENCAEVHHGTSLDVPLRPLGTEGWDGQVGQRIVLRDTMGRPMCRWDGRRVMLKDRHYGTSLMSHSSLRN